MNLDRDFKSLADIKKLAVEIQPKVKDGNDRESMLEVWAVLAHNKDKIMDVLRNNRRYKAPRHLWAFLPTFIDALNPQNEHYSPQAAVQAARNLFVLIARLD